MRKTMVVLVAAGVLFAALFTVVQSAAMIPEGSTKKRSALFTVTAYCLKGRTFTGTRVKHGTIAVDPRLIELGTKMRVHHYGSGVALDTGGAIKGYHVDVWMSSCSRAIRWGIRKERVWW